MMPYRSEINKLNPSKPVSPSPIQQINAVIMELTPTLIIESQKKKGPFFNEKRSFLIEIRQLDFSKGVRTSPCSVTARAFRYALAHLAGQNSGCPLSYEMRRSLGGIKDIMPPRSPLGRVVCPRSSRNAQTVGVHCLQKCVARPPLSDSKLQKKAQPQLVVAIALF